MLTKSCNEYREWNNVSGRGPYDKTGLCTLYMFSNPFHILRFGYWLQSHGLNHGEVVYFVKLRQMVAIHHCHPSTHLISNKQCTCSDHLVSVSDFNSLAYFITWSPLPPTPCSFLRCIKLPQGLMEIMDFKSKYQFSLGRWRFAKSSEKLQHKAFFPFKFFLSLTYFCK